jgi:hypothetical protein
MKTKLIFIMGAIFICTFIGAQELKAQEKTTKYYVVTSWVEYYNGKEKRPIVTNVVKVVCKYQFESSVSNQFSNFFDAEHKKRSGGFLNHAHGLVFTFDTYEKAEKRRRELIADYNNDDWYPYLVKDFTFMCDD